MIFSNPECVARDTKLLTHCYRLNGQVAVPHRDISRVYRQAVYSLSVHSSSLFVVRVEFGLSLMCD